MVLGQVDFYTPCNTEEELRFKSVSVHLTQNEGKHFFAVVIILTILVSPDSSMWTFNNIKRESISLFNSQGR